MEYFWSIMVYSDTIFFVANLWMAESTWPFDRTFLYHVAIIFDQMNPDFGHAS